MRVPAVVQASGRARGARGLRLRGRDGHGGEVVVVGRRRSLVGAAGGGGGGGRS